MLAAFASALALLLTSGPPADIDPTKLGPPSFSDDFQTTRICNEQFDRTCKGKHWLPIYGYGGPTSWSNRDGADAVYVDPGFPGVKDDVLQPRPLGQNPFKLTRDYLQITASPTPQALKPLLWNKPFMSGLLSSRELYTFTYGYTEVTADLPLCTKGAWPAIWTVVLGGWPTGGEDDFPEDIGTGKHWFSNVNPDNQAKHGSSAVFSPPTGCTRGFHRFGALKTSTDVGLYYDGHRVGWFPTTPDMHLPHMIILNLAMGGGWASGASGPPDPNATTYMRIHDVKVWAPDR